MNFSHVGRLFKLTVMDYFGDDAPGLGAALAFYSMLSIGPLLLIALGVAGLFLGHEAAQAKLIAEIGAMVGSSGAMAVKEILDATSSREDTNLIATAIGIGTLLLGASGTFGQLHHALNVIWKVPKADRDAWLTILRERFLSFSMMLGTSFLLLVSLILTAVLAAMSESFSTAFGEAEWLIAWCDAALNLSVLTVLFALMFRYLPDADVKWCDVWWGGFLTAFLFLLGKTAIGVYLGRSGLDSAYGAAGSFVVLLFWVYYSAQILFFGAEFTQVYARHKKPPQTKA